MKAYLAGPDVFRVDSVAHGERMKELCEEYGIEALYPLDNLVPEHLEGEEAAQWICQANMEMIREADVVLANLQIFRGHELDSGTVFEVGVATALNTPVIAYFPNTGDMRQQIPTDTNGLCSDGYFVEDFGLPRNLMLACQWAGQAQDFHAAVEMASAFNLRGKPNMQLG